MTRTVVRPLHPRVVNGRVRWGGRLEHPSAQAEVSFEFACPDPDGFVPTGRPVLLALLPVAMRLGAPVDVAGPVDATTLDNLMEWQDATAAWHRDLHVVPVRAEVADPPWASARPSGAVTAFSGGVDSAFTAVRHGPLTRTASHDAQRSADLTAGLMVQGFDVRPDDSEVWAGAWARSRRMLGALGLDAFDLCTDVRRLEAEFGCRWGSETHGIWLGAALSCLEQWFGPTIVPSSYPYPHLQLPWGSTPITDPLLGSGSRPLWHDGARHDKLDKVLHVAADAAVGADVRVCWEGPSHDRNCGHCYKCVVTQACFWLAGVAHPGAFPDRCAVTEVGDVVLKDPYKVHLARKMQDLAQRTGADEIAHALARSLAAVGA